MPGHVWCGQHGVCSPRQGCPALSPPGPCTFSAQSSESWRPPEPGASSGAVRVLRLSHDTSPSRFTLRLRTHSSSSLRTPLCKQPSQTLRHLDVPHSSSPQLTCEHLPCRDSATPVPVLLPCWVPVPCGALRQAQLISVAQATGQAGSPNSLLLQVTWAEAEVVRTKNRQQRPGPESHILDPEAKPCEPACVGGRPAPRMPRAVVPQRM